MAFDFLFCTCVSALGLLDNKLFLWTHVQALKVDTVSCLVDTRDLVHLVSALGTEFLVDELLALLADHEAHRVAGNNVPVLDAIMDWDKRLGLGTNTGRIPDNVSNVYAMVTTAPRVMLKTHFPANLFLLIGFMCRNPASLAQARGSR